LAYNIQPVKSAWTGTVYIRADGSIDPPDAPIITYDNITYTLTDNIISDADGIVVERDNIVVDGAGHIVQGTENGTGITLSSNNVTIRNTNIQGFWNGIYLNSSKWDIISANNLTNNEWGIYFLNCSCNAIVGNNLIDNWGGIYVGSSSHNILEANYIDFKNKDGGIYGIYLDSGNYPGSCSYNTIFRNTITRIREVGAITLYLASNNLIKQNFITRGHGIWLWWGSENNTIIQNSINMSAPEGYYWHMEISRSSGNKFYYNNFIANKDQISIYESTNVWDNGYPGGGNYWSNYTGVDSFSGPYQDQLGSDGIGDAPYVIDKYNKDRYPLMKPLSPPPPAYPLAEWIESPNYTPADERNITYIVIHVMDGYFEGTIDWFQNPDSQASAHYLVSQEGEIVQMVREKDIAWHAGNWEYNQRSIGIEHEDKGNWDKPNWATEELYQASAALVRYLCDKYGIPKDRTHIIGHNEVPGVTKPCPGPYWDWDYFMGLVKGVPAPRKFWAVWEDVDYPVLILSNSTVSNFNFNQPEAQMSFKISGETGTSGYCNVTIPKTLLKGEPWTVKLNGTNWNFQSFENETHSFIYFTYTHASTFYIVIQGTWVIPEFPSTTILTLLMLATLIATILLKRRRKNRNVDHFPNFSVFFLLSAYAFSVFHERHA